MPIEQLELFEKTDIELVKEDFEKLEKKQDNLRKGLFARHSTLAKSITDIQSQIHEIQAQLYILSDCVK